MADPTLVISLPLQLRAYPTQMYYHKKAPDYQPVPYAYCLLDFAAEDAASPAKVFASNPAFIDEEITKEVKWQLPCRTNGKGYLVAVDEKNHTLMNVLYRDDSDARAFLDRMPPLVFNAGMRFNLFWSYDHRVFRAARRPADSPCRKELQLHRCSTMFNAGEKIMLKVVCGSVRARYKDLVPKNEQDLAKQVEKLFFREKKTYTRVLIHSGAEVQNIQMAPLWNPRQGSRMTYTLRPHLPLDDEDLRYALFIADCVIPASTAPIDKDAFGSIAILEHVLKILKQRGKEKTINDIIPLHYRCEQFDFRYSGAKSNIENSFKRVALYVDDFAKRLAPIHQNAILQATAHYPKAEREYAVERIQKAAGICAARALWDDFLCSGDAYQKKLDKIKEVLKGKPPGDLVESLVGSYQSIQEPLEKGTAFIEKSSEWIEAFIPRIVQSKPEKVVDVLNRLNHLIHVVNDPAKISTSVEKVFELTGKGVTLNVTDVDGKPVQFLLHERVGNVKAFAARMGQIISVINLALSLRELSNDPSFKNYVRAFKDATDVANAFQRIQKELATKFGITEAALTRVAGSAVAAVALIDAVDHLKQGNNMAVLGDMIIAVGGTVQVLSRGGGVGLIVAGIVLVGTLIVYFSLDEDEKFMIVFNDRYWSSIKYSYDHRFLRTQQQDLQFVDSYLKVRASAT